MVIQLLDEIEKYLSNELEKENFSMPKLPNEGNIGIDDVKMVVPKIAKGCLPHENFGLYGATEGFFQAPYGLINISKINQNFDSSTIECLFQACTVSSSDYEGSVLPDNKGYEDLFLFLEWVKQKLIRRWTFGRNTLSGNIEIGTYNTKDMTYPFSFGYVSFSLTGRGIEVKRNKFDY